MVAIEHRALGRLGLWLGCLLMAVLAAAAARAQPDELPGRVGRLADVQGKVWLFDTEQGQWAEAQRNRALTEGDRLSTERGARAEVRIGSTELRLAGGTELVFNRLDDERMVFRLQSGSLALRVRSRELADEIEIRTAEGRLVPERSGHYRIDREDDTTFAAPWRGSLRFESAPDAQPQQVQVPAGRRAEFFQQPRERTTVVSWSNPREDGFAEWVLRDEQRDDRSAAQQYVSPEMTGADDLDRYGRWERHPEYGVLWSPMQVAVGWAPYRHGRWAWQARWGWSWVDDAPWGFAPFHYGRWVHWGGRWAWAPGVYVARPAYAPALVAWVGGPQVSVSVNIGGGPAVGWLPLAPYDVYVPAFRHGPRYYEHVNRPQYPQRPPQVPTGPVMYGNNGVPGAVTVVPSNVLAQRQPVAPAARVIAVPGGAQPVALAPVAPPARGAAPAPMPATAPAPAVVRVGPVPTPAAAVNSTRSKAERMLDLKRERERERVAPAAPQAMQAPQAPQQPVLTAPQVVQPVRPPSVQPQPQVVPAPQRREVQREGGKGQDNRPREFEQPRHSQRERQNTM